MSRLLSVVMPAYNEGEAIGHALAALEPVLASLPVRTEVVVVNDGSRDDTLAQARAFRSQVFELVVVDLSRNFGKEAAVSAGLAQARGDAVIPIDADLQDPPALIPRMVERWLAGAEVVLGRRADRSRDTWLKRNTARGFYRVMSRVSDVPIPEDVGDFRLMDRAVVDVVKALPENRRFMKGLFAWAGFRTEVIDYERPERVAGDTKFRALSMINHAVEGITSFSTVPLRLATLLGALVAMASFVYGLFIIGYTLWRGTGVPGYASLMSVLLFVSGVQLMALGVVGEYVGRTYIEAKRRPAFVVREVWRGGGPEPDRPRPEA